MVAAVKVGGDASSSEEEEPGKIKKNKKTPKEKVRVEVAVIEKKPPVPAQTIMSLPQPMAPMSTASTPPQSNVAVYGSAVVNNDEGGGSMTEDEPTPPPPPPRRDGDTPKR